MNWIYMRGTNLCVRVGGLAPNENEESKLQVATNKWAPTSEIMSPMDGKEDGGTGRRDGHGMSEERMSPRE